jgi:hypothetical protein
MSAQARPQPDLAGDCNVNAIEGRQIGGLFYYFGTLLSFMLSIDFLNWTDSRPSAKVEMSSG